MWKICSPSYTLKALQITLMLLLALSEVFTNKKTRPTLEILSMTLTFFLLDVVNQDEVREPVSSFKPKAFPGQDWLPVYILKTYIDFFFALPLIGLFNVQAVVFIQFSICACDRPMTIFNKGQSMENDNKNL